MNALYYGALSTLVILLSGSLPAAEPLPERIEFNRDIRPILSDTCFACHGPDKAKRQADLRLDNEADALADHDGKRPLVPGDLKASEIYRRITSTDADQQMPPADSGRKLTQRQVALIGRWIEQGAKWQGHWSLIPPVRPTIPIVKNGAWPKNAIDTFILARLEQEGLAPSPEADRTTLIRRVTLDLTGLPPTPAEVDAFLADKSPDAYEKVVERLLASPRFGERMAARWLDGARYADTSGYQTDGPRDMWRWRDWVIEAYNRNLPFDQFTIEQLAGDLLPSPTLDQRIATGFNRNHRGNAEGGIIPEEYAVEYVVDRVETTATVWLGLTLGCTRCHDHKFDPFTQREFYGLFGYFNNVPEKGRAVKYGNSPPYLKSPTRRQVEQLAQLDRRLVSATQAFAELGPQIESAQTEWEKGKPAVGEWTIERGLAARQPFEGELKDAKFTDGEPAFAPGRVGQAARFDGKRFIDAGNVGDFAFYDKFSLSAWVNPSGEKGGTIISRMTDADQADGYYLSLVGGKLQFNLVKRWLDDSLRVESVESLVPGRWQHVTVTYDASREASGVRLYLDGRPAKLRVVLDELNQPFTTKEPLRIGGGGGLNGRFHGAIDEARVYSRDLTPEEAAILSVPESLPEILALPLEKRSAAQQAKLRTAFLDRFAPEPMRAAHEKLLALTKERHNLVESFPTTMVMQELPEPRPTFLLLRGEYDKRGERVPPGVPKILAPSALPEGVNLPFTEAPQDRLSLARLIVSSVNPLTARVAVNRQWQMLFGVGIVKTVDDFGSQGEWPTHPELLDWLATEFQDGPPAFRQGSLHLEEDLRLGERNREIKWDIKALARLMVTSSTYRQSSKATPALLARDPENRLLARAPRVRLSAQTIRDQALAASGLLGDEIGGPSVMPYQPAGLWTELAGGIDYAQDHGAKLYRRGLYTYWKRTSAPPSMMTFDAAARETCVVRETRTNTPLQALTLLNDVTYVEAARVLAERAIESGGPSARERVSHAFRLVLSRNPSARELEILTQDYAEHLARFRKEIAAAAELLSVGESIPNPRLDPSELAALTAVAGLILNLDEAITRE